MESSKTVKVLHVVTSIDVGGVSTFLLSFYENMNHKKVHFDIVAIDRGKKQLFEDAFSKLGASVYYMPKNYYKRLLFFCNLIKHGKYDIVHSHIELASAVYLFVSYILGVKNRIAHAHMAFHKYDSFIQKILRLLLLKISTVKMGCTYDALINLFGLDGKSGLILHDAIDIQKFSYNQDIRVEYRKNFNIENKYVIGFVGRLTEQKNIFFLLDIFNSFSSKHPEAILMIVGDGELKDEFFKEASNKGLIKNILYLGPRKDVNKLMMSMDILLLPSKWEGLGIVLIEAQTAALKCIASKETIPYNDTNVSEYICYCSIKSQASVWGNLIEQECMNYKRKKIDEKIRDHHYDIIKEAEWLANFYIELKLKS